MNYQTSYEIGHRYINQCAIPQVHREIRRIVYAHIYSKDYLAHAETYSLTSRKSYNTKYKSFESDSPGKPKHHQEIQYMRNVKDQNAAYPLKELKFKETTHYKDEYTLKSLPPSVDLVSASPRTVCTSYTVTLNDKPCIPASVSSIAKESDQYVSVTKFVHSSFTPHQLGKLTMQQENYLPKYEEQMIGVKENPMVDKTIFSKKLDTRKPKPTWPVPHSGMKTETQAQYRPPLDRILS